MCCLPYVFFLYCFAKYAYRTCLWCVPSAEGACRGLLVWRLNGLGGACRGLPTWRLNGDELEIPVISGPVLVRRPNGAKTCYGTCVCLHMRCIWHIDSVFHTHMVVYIHFTHIVHEYWRLLWGPIMDLKSLWWRRGSCLTYKGLFWKGRDDWADEG